MLAYVLALVIALGSLAIYMTAFFFPEVHRKEDFIWSGVGLFYALVLWVCAGRITGGVLLGQMASVALLGWFGWQTLTLRRSLTPAEDQTAIPSQSELQAKLKDLPLADTLKGLPERVTGLFRKDQSETQTAQAPVAATVSSPVVTVIDATTTQTEPAIADEAPSIEQSTTEVTEVTDTTIARPTTQEAPAADDGEISESPELVRPNPPDPELVEAAQNSAPYDASELSEEAATPIEAIAPEVELAPPAEPPGPGDPEDRLAAPDAAASIEVVPIDPENPPAQT